MTICRRLPIILLASLLTLVGTPPGAAWPDPGLQPGDSPAAGASQTRGHLVIVGGGGHAAEIMNRFVALAGGPEHAKILVLPMASGDAEEAGREQVDEFRALGVHRTTSWNMSRREAEDRRVADSLKEVTGVFFTGGDQARITAVLHGTPAERAFRELYRRGAVIGGTSAGAAVMSELMITGNEKLSRDTVNAFTVIRKDNIEITPGLGLVTNAVIDQHFIRRKRHNRLISVVLEHPGLLGIGIDERTAVVVNPDSTMDVIGKGSVLLFDARHATAIKADSAGLLSGSNILMHLLAPGEGYDFRTGMPRTLEQPRP